MRVLGSSLFVTKLNKRVLIWLYLFKSGFLSETWHWKLVSFCQKVGHVNLDCCIGLDAFLALYFNYCYCWIVSWVKILMCGLVTLFSGPVMSIALLMGK